MKILKFGGSSVASPERIRDVSSIILRAHRKERVVVVVSAFQGITNQLIECSRLAESGNANFRPAYRRIADRHRSTLRELHNNRPAAKDSSAVDAMLEELFEVLHGISLLRHCSPRALDLTASFGERMSAAIVASYLRRSHPALAVDARDMVRTDEHFTKANVLFDATNPAIRKYFATAFSGKNRTAIPVVTGFIGATEDGRTTTIGRNGSDYSAAIFGAALKVSVIEIWTDVDGILSADPRDVEDAFLVERLSYEEAMELSYFGAKVLHAATIAPAVAGGIPIAIKNSLNPAAPGTTISGRTDLRAGVAKGITAVDDCTLLNLRGMNMVGVPGTAERVFRTLAASGVNVILISQASSEHTICLAVNSADAPAAVKAIGREFRLELQNKFVTLDQRPGQSIVAIVGDGMRGTPGVSGKVFQSLGRNQINVSAIAQGASERNISFVIDSAQKRSALNVIHQGFFDIRKRLSVVVIGTGNVGGTLLGQLHRQRSELLEQGFDVRVVGIANSRRYLLSPQGLDLAGWRTPLDHSPRRMDRAEFLRELSALPFNNAVVVDCTASGDVVDLYEDFVRLNMHIVTPNKRANVLPWKKYRKLMDLLDARQKYFLFEANVGAGLPVISTLNDLITSGDQVVKIEGIFSGTLSYLFNQYDGIRPFSVFVQEALELGFSEPDPREDLSGGDVARKLLILARQLGLRMDMHNIRAENLVPRPLRTGKFRKEFFRRFSKYDDDMRRRLDKARLQGSVLRYVGVLQGRAAFAGIRNIPVNHPFASTKGSDNIIAFTTHRYARTPLVVQGPGAGADVTAMGVFSDLLKLLHYLPS